ncbi:hypothetical protein AVEN_235068-1, partial [Araneus ventricosus]
MDGQNEAHRFNNPQSTMPDEPYFYEPDDDDLNLDID